MEKNLRRVIESQGNELEERIHQMSQIRLIADTMSEGIQEPQYLKKVCENLMEILGASSCLLLLES